MVLFSHNPKHVKTFSLFFLRHCTIECTDISMSFVKQTNINGLTVLLSLLRDICHFNEQEIKRLLFQNYLSYNSGWIMM